MTQENKELLLKDLCARLPYGVKVRYSSTKEFITCKLHSINPIHTIVNLWSKGACFTSVHISKIKPYLFPLSSMTDEQKEELQKLGWNFDGDDISNSESYYSEDADYVTHFECYSLIEWLNKNHFDYRGLIPKGIALDATGKNIY